MNGNLGWFYYRGSMNLSAEMLLRFQWQMENLLQVLGLGVGFILISPFILITIE